MKWTDFGFIRGKQLLGTHVIPRLGENAKHLNLEAVNTESLGESFFANSSTFGIVAA